MIRLGQSMDGRLILGSSQPFPADIKYVEYFKEQRLFSLVYDTPDEESALMPCEVPDDIAAQVEASPNIMIVAMFENGQEPYGYMVPLIRIGI